MRVRESGERSLALPHFLTLSLSLSTLSLTHLQASGKGTHYMSFKTLVLKMAPVKALTVLFVPSLLDDDTEKGTPPCRLRT